MFTGIVEDLGSLLALQRGTESARLRIATGLPLDVMKVGDSVAVDGCCLTVVEKTTDALDFEAAAETLRVTTLGERAVGDKVHLERAMSFGGRLDGHLVAGHVDSVGEVKRVTERGPALEVVFEAPRELLRYVIVKGSIAVDGVSLTVNALDDIAGTFSVMLIPHTLSVTHLGKSPGARVNLETDLVGKFIERLVLPWRSETALPDPPSLRKRAIDLAFLQAHGFAKE